jgi:hypothetical protein
MPERFVFDSPTPRHALSRREVEAIGDASVVRAGLGPPPAPRSMPQHIQRHLTEAGASAQQLRLESELRLLEEADDQAYALNSKYMALANTLSERILDQSINERARDNHKHLRGDDFNNALNDWKRAKSELETAVSSLRSRIDENRKTSAQWMRRQHLLEQRQKACYRLLAEGRDAVKFVPAPAAGKATIAEVRSKIASLKLTIEETELAVLPLKLVKQEIARFVDARAKPIAVSPLFRGEVPYVPLSFNTAAEGMGTPDAFAVSCWYDRDRIISAMCQRAEAEAEDQGEALDPAERVKRIAKAREDILALERVDEALCWQALQRGDPVDLRAEADPRAILCCEQI